MFEVVGFYKFVKISYLKKIQKILLETLKKKITKKTKMIFVENPGSNSFEFQDLSNCFYSKKK